MDNCLFCKIIKGEIPSQKVYEDEYAFAFKDIHPQAPVHVLVVSKTHVKDVLEGSNLKSEEMAAIIRACGEVAKITGIEESGFRIVSNCGHDSCQSVPHLHFHVLGGKLLSEKMS
jgi:histidine triad (HIT) family protein